MVGGQALIRELPGRGAEVLSKRKRTRHWQASAPQRPGRDEGKTSHALQKLALCNRVVCNRAGGAVGVDRRRPNRRLLEIPQPEGPVGPVRRRRTSRPTFIRPDQAPAI